MSEDIQKLINEKEKELLAAEIEAARAAIEMKDKLPHLYAFKHYKWSRKFFDSKNKECFLIAGNQLGKSSIQIRKVIHWATDKSLWKKLWPHLTPNQFWYLYPTKDLATAEFHTKWKQFLPKDKDDPIYGWEADFERKNIKSISFKSGIIVYFKTYAQDVQDLQSGTCFYMALDEEVPIELLGELSARLNATDGYLSMAFTPTLGQEHWRRTMEPRVGEKEEHSNALKLKVSLYDCLLYDDGTQSHWTAERIQRIEAKCPTSTDVQIRVFGKFARSSGRKYEAYDPVKNRSENHPLPRDWHVYSGIDIGSGGDSGHPSAVTFLAVDPLFRRGRVFKAWRGDGIPTTSGDTYVKYVELRGELKPALQCYDFQSAEFKRIAEGAGDNMEPADKRHDVGERVLNTLFKHGMLSIQHGDDELDKLSLELETLSRDTPKQIAHDDLADALRYACTKIPWDFSFLDGLPVAPVKVERELTDEDRRRGGQLESWDDMVLIEQEIDEWNEHYGS